MKESSQTSCCSEGSSSSSGGGSRIINNKVEDNADQISTPPDDWFSRLPDNVVLHILSFLTTSQVGRLSLVSRRWRHLWAYTPTLDFSGIRHSDNKELIVFSVMLHHECSTVRRFRLSHYTHASSRTIRQWLDFLVTYNSIEELCLQFFPYHWEDYHSSSGNCNADNEKDNVFHDLPANILSFGLLRVLELQGCKFSRTGIMDVRHLTILSLCRIHAREEILQHLISGCPLIGELTLDRCVTLTHLELCKLHLRRLKLHCCHNLRNIEIKSPNLCFIDYWGECSDNLKFSMRNSEHLVEVNLYLCHLIGNSVDEARRLGNLLLELCQGTVLKICNIIRDLTRSIILSESTWQQFNVKQLVLHYDRQNIAVFSLATILRGFPNVEDLELSPSAKNSRPNDQEPKELLGLASITIDCLQHCLKRIKITGFSGKNSEVEVAKFLVQNAKVLEQINIDTQKGGGSLSEHLRVRYQLINWKASEKARIMSN